MFLFFCVHFSVGWLLHFNIKPLPPEFLQRSHQSENHKIMAALTIGLTPTCANAETRAALQQQMTTGNSYILRLISAIAFVFLFGKDKDDIVTDILIDAEIYQKEINPLTDIIPYKRPLMGFYALARHKLEV
jgi:hypothetical protein